MELKLLLGGTDASQLLISATVSGTRTTCSRTASISILQSPSDDAIPTVDAAPGKTVQLYADGELFFDGFVIERTKASNSSSLTLDCYDRGFWLTRNQGVWDFQKKSAASAVSTACGEFGISVGKNLSGGTMKDNYIGKTLWTVIQDAMTRAAESGGKEYTARFEGESLNIVEAGSNADKVEIAEKVNLQDATMTDSIKDTYTRTVVVNSAGKTVTTKDAGELQGLYGIIQTVVKQADEQSDADTAQGELDIHGLKQTVTVNCLGDLRLISGDACTVTEPYTGVVGTFLIEGDTHTFKKGQYYTKVKLSFMEG